MSDLEHGLLPGIASRRARRALSDRPIARETVETILRAAHIAPSCFNNQPWRFVPVDEPEVLAGIKEAMPGGNYWTAPAPVIIAVASRRDFDCTLSDSRDYFLFGCGMAVANLMIEATHRGLIAHPIAGYKPALVKSVLDIPEDYILITLVILAAPGSVEGLSDNHLETESGPRVRRPLPDVMAWNRFSLDRDS
jgi:nitroreductase